MYVPTHIQITFLFYDYLRFCGRNSLVLPHGGSWDQILTRSIIELPKLKVPLLE